MYLVQKKGRGVWYLVDVECGPDEKRKKVWRSTKTDSKEEAEAILRETEASKSLVKTQKHRKEIRNLIVERATAASAVLVQQRTPFDEAWRVYLDDPRTQDLKPASLERVRSCWAALVAAVTVDCVEAFTYDDAVAFLAVYQRGRSSGSVITCRTILQTVFARIRRPLGLPDNPFADMYVQRGEKKIHRCFTSEEIQMILKALPRGGEWYAVCMLSLYTGMRFGDCCTLKAEHVRDGVIVRPVGKLERFGTEAVIPVHTELAPVLISRKRTQQGSDYLFPELAKSYCKRKSLPFFGNLLRRLGIKTENDTHMVDFHSFRHTFITRLIEGDTDVGVRLKLAGHSNVKTNQIYNHASVALTRAINNLPTVNDGTQHQQEEAKVDL